MNGMPQAGRVGATLVRSTTGATKRPACMQFPYAKEPIPAAPGCKTGRLWCGNAATGIPNLSDFGTEHHGSANRNTCAKCPTTGALCFYIPSHFLNKCFVVSLLIAAMDVVSGMPFGQERTQFCELPQPSMPPSSISASRRSAAFISPVG